MMHVSCPEEGDNGRSVLQSEWLSLGSPHSETGRASVTL